MRALAVFVLLAGCKTVDVVLPSSVQTLSDEPSEQCKPIGSVTASKVVQIEAYGAPRAIVAEVAKDLRIRAADMHANYVRIDHHRATELAEEDEPLRVRYRLSGAAFRCPDPPEPDSGSLLGKWWFWTAIGASVAGGAALAVALTQERTRVLNATPID